MNQIQDPSFDLLGLITQSAKYEVTEKPLKVMSHNSWTTKNFKQNKV